MLKIEEVKDPEVGSIYLVSTLIDLSSVEKNEIGEMIYDQYPIYPLLHSDRENGQELPHYHVDTRFQERVQMLRIYPDQFSNTVEYLPWKLLHELENYHTFPKATAKSKLKHKCIHKGKCPHRGFDLTNVRAKNGVITCPLHGLRFREESGELIY